MWNAKHIERVLRSEVERTRTLYKAEAANYQNITRDVPSGIPFPDGVTRIRQASQAHNHALDVYMIALRRLNDYTIRKIVPDDLKQKVSDEPERDPLSRAGNLR
jgi:hypothetical protein